MNDTHDLQTYVKSLHNRLRARPASVSYAKLAAVSERLGEENAISADWIARFAVGRMRNPTVRSLSALAKALDQAGVA